MRWNSPPNWPTPPPGWTPPAGWQPDPAWGPPPPGHALWVSEQPASSLNQPGFHPNQPGYGFNERGYQSDRPTAEFAASPYPGAVPPGDGRGGGRSSLWIVVALVAVLVLALAAAVALTVLGRDGDDDTPASSRTDVDPTPEPTEDLGEPTEDPTDEPAETDSVPAEPTPEPTEPTLPLGESAPVGDWVVSVDAVEQDANQLIEDTNDFNVPPIGQYVVAELTVTYQGAGRSDAWLDVQPSFVEPDGTEHPHYECSAVVPEPAFNTPSLRRGDSASYQVCYDVPVDSISGGRIDIVDLANIGDEGVAWAVR